MDKGAHFLRTDLQVHTPRDPRWGGVGAITDDERKQYALEFVRACREKALDAVAITDHHDWEFVPYIREAAANETDENGTPIKDSHKLVVFPGMELTLGLPCQALLIFDANFPADSFSLVYGKLSVVPSARADERIKPTEKLDHIRDLQDLHDKLDEHEFLRGRYIILPNVSDGGNHTLLRSGFHSHYKNMPCVGGYTDKARMAVGNTAIVEGRDPAYGNRAIGVFHTSDSRSRDFTSLGVPSVWIKWAVPTAEALRQACLARSSRLSTVKPPLPEVFITSISVSNSKFLGPLVLEFNRQANALIGGRGTGKSTILEYIRWALCDEPPIMGDDDEQDYMSKRQKLIEGTLESQRGNIRVNFIKNGVTHSVSRDTVTNRIQLKIDQGEYEDTTEENIRSILPIQGYSQKQLSNVAVRIDQLQRFIRAPVDDVIRDAERDLTNLESNIRAKYAQVVRQVQLTQQKANLEKEAQSLASQINALKKGLTGLSPADQLTINARPLINQEQSVLERINASYEQVPQLFADITNSLKATLDFDKIDIESLPNKEVLKPIIENMVKAYSAASASIESVQKQLDAALGDEATIATPIAKIERTHLEYEAQYQAALKNSSAHKKSLEQITAFEKRQRELGNQIALIDAELKKLGQPDLEVSSLRNKLRECHERIGNLFVQQCQSLTELSGGSIKATLRKHTQFENVKDQIASIVKGTGIKGAKIEDMIAAVIANPNPLELWATYLTELEILSQIEKPVTETTTLPTIEFLSKHFNRAEMLKLSGKLTPDNWLNLALTRVDSEPEFQYRVRENDYIKFAAASAGQQATALLSALLNQDGPPLIIDQPEDDLDSQTVIRITDLLIAAKTKRQIIFTSHNANLVVIGDAELVVCCDYKIAGEQSTGHIKLEGAIDMKAVREEITQVMEGGEKAFRNRFERYGY